MAVPEFVLVQQIKNAEELEDENCGGNDGFFVHFFLIIIVHNIFQYFHSNLLHTIFFHRNVKLSCRLFQLMNLFYSNKYYRFLRVNILYRKPSQNFQVEFSRLFFSFSELQPRKIIGINNRISLFILSFLN